MRPTSPVRRLGSARLWPGSTCLAPALRVSPPAPLVLWPGWQRAAALLGLPSLRQDAAAQNVADLSSAVAPVEEPLDDTCKDDDPCPTPVVVGRRSNLRFFGVPTVGAAGAAVLHHFAAASLCYSLGRKPLIPATSCSPATNFPAVTCPFAWSTLPLPSVLSSFHWPSYKLPSL